MVLPKPRNQGATRGSSQFGSGDLLCASIALRQRRTVRVPSWARQMMLYGAVAVAVLTILVTFLVIQAEITDTSWRIDGLKKELAAKMNEHQELQLKLSRLQSYDRIEHVATTELGMSKPDDIVYLESR